MNRFNIERAIILPCHEPCFQLTSLCFQPPFHHIPKAHHRKIIVYILKFLIDRVALNFSNDVGSWCSHSMTLTSKIQRISVLTTSSQTFFPSHPPFISPPNFIQIWWGFFPTTCLAFDMASFSFLYVLRSALATLFGFSPPIIVTLFWGTMGWA